MLNYKFARTPYTHVKLDDTNPLVIDPKLYMCLVRPLQYLTFTRIKLTYVVQYIDLFMCDS